MALLRELHRLRNRGVGRHAAHREQLVRAETEQVAQVGIEAHEPALHALAEIRVEDAPLAQHPVNEFLCPPAITRVQRADAQIEGDVEQLAAAKIGAEIGGDSS